MSQLLAPRAVGPDAWKRWCKESGRLMGRTWLSAGPMIVLVGLAGGWLMEIHFGFFFLMLPLMLFWETLLLSMAERAAEGKRITVGDALDGVVGFWSSGGWGARNGLKLHFLATSIASVGFGALLLGLLGLADWLVAASPETASRPMVAVPSLFAQVSDWASWWSILFMWGWALPRRLLLSCCNPLVRRTGVTWEASGKLWDLGLALNFKSIRILSLSCLVLCFALLLGGYLSVLIFPLELFWACLTAVVYRDVFEEKEALETQEARFLSSSPTLA